MAAIDNQPNTNHFAPQGTNGFRSYDPKALTNYAAMSAICWPGFDYSQAYTQASALAAAATSLGQNTPVSTFGQTQSSIASSSSPPSPPSSQTALLSGSAPQMSQVSGGFQSTPLGFPAHSTTSSSPKKKAQPVPDDLKDETYWERRKRNNESARRSRESRRMKEEQIALRVVYLEQENLQLRTEVSMLRAEIEKMRMLLYNTTHHH